MTNTFFCAICFMCNITTYSKDDTAKYIQNVCGVCRDNDGAVYYCDTSKCVYRLGKDQEITKICTVRKDFEYLIKAHEDTVHYIASGKLYARKNNIDLSIYTLDPKYRSFAMSRDSKILSYSTGPKINFVDLTTGKLVSTYSHADDSAFCCQVDYSDCDNIAILSYAGFTTKSTDNIIVINYATGKVLKTYSINCPETKAFFTDPKKVDSIVHTKDRQIAFWADGKIIKNYGAKSRIENLDYCNGICAVDREGGVYSERETGLFLVGNTKVSFGHIALVYNTKNYIVLYVQSKNGYIALFSK